MNQPTNNTQYPDEVSPTIHTNNPVSENVHSDTQHLEDDELRNKLSLEMTGYKYGELGAKFLGIHARHMVDAVCLIVKARDEQRVEAIKQLQTYKVFDDDADKMVELNDVLATLTQSPKSLE